MHLINPISSSRLGYPPASVEKPSQFHAIPSLKPSPILQDLQHKTQKIVPDEELLSLFSIGPRESLEESGLPELENAQQFDSNEFLLKDSLLFDSV